MCEDNPVNAKLVSALIAKAGFDSLIAENGEKALHHLQTENFDLILMDCQMPEMDGYILTRHIKTDPRFAGIPVVMHSSLSGTSNSQLGRSVGVDEYVAKFEPQRLAETLVRLAKSGGSSGLIHGKE